MLGESNRRKKVGIFRELENVEVLMHMTLYLTTSKR